MLCNQKESQPKSYGVKAASITNELLAVGNFR